MSWSMCADLNARLFVSVSAIYFVCAPEPLQAQGDDIQKQLSNPIASLTVVPIQSNFDFGIGPDRDGSRITTNIQPVVPFKLNDQLSLVVRTILPVIGQENVFLAQALSSGLATRCRVSFSCRRA